MKKILLLLGLTGLIVALVAYLAVTFFLGSIVKAGVNNFGPKLTQTRVVLAGATLSPFTGSGTLTGLTVGNPRGWSDGPAFSLGRIHVDLEPMSVFGDHVVINEIIIDQPEFAYETKIVSSNIKELLKNIEAFAGDGGKPAATKEGKPIKFIVKKFRLTNAKATLAVVGGGTAVPVPLPPVSLDDLGVAEGGITADQLARALMQPVLRSIIAGTADALTQPNAAATLEKTKEAVQQAADSLKGLFQKK